MGYKQIDGETIIKPCPSPEVEVCLRKNSSSRAGLGIDIRGMLAVWR
jgi:hypothetical protein